jgi:hypothetical protein
MYAAVNDRMRDMTSEKVDRSTTFAGSRLDRNALQPAAAFRVQLIDEQLPLLRERHLFLRRALQALYSTEPRSTPRRRTL